jgi:hypothetical protein
VEGTRKNPMRMIALKERLPELIMDVRAAWRER